jgi:cytochrome c-type biogenesis protein CcmH/NrfG
MVENDTRDEFARSGLEATTHKAWRNSKNILELARRIQRQTRITVALAVVAVALLMLAIYMLWRVLERLPHTIPSSG